MIARGDPAFGGPAPGADPVLAMSGHSHFANIMRSKGRTDAKRAREFSAVAKFIMVAARLGGGNPADNPRLALYVEKARALNMPKDTIQRAIDKATGALAGGQVEEFVFEAFGPAGVGILLDVMTDNRLRAVPAIRAALEHHGGHVGHAGSVSWNFERKGHVHVAASATTEDRLIEVALDAGADDVTSHSGGFTVVTPVGAFEAVKRALGAARIPVESSDLVHVPKNPVPLDEDAARKLMSLVSSLEEVEDVQSVATNADVSEAVASRLAQA